MSLRDDYAGPFDPDLDLHDFSRQTLADLGREYLLNGHLQDRVALPLVAKHLGGEAYVGVSIAEWMSASPVYSKRMQRALGFEGRDVGTVFKNIQLEIGAPQQFMDFQFRLDAPDYGEFWLPFCGALADVEPYGDDRVKLMCHDIEDPTFDATAAATHPGMKMRPLHRPPRSPAGRYPACRWKVFIDEHEEPAAPHPNLERVAASQIARLEIPPPPPSREPGGWDDYAGPFEPGLQLEDFSHRALQVIAREVALQSHLLARSFMLCIAEREGDAMASELGAAQWTGIAALTAERLRACLRIEGDDADAIAKLFQVHPCFRPRAYVDLRVERVDEAVRIAIHDCPALREGDAYSWFATLDAAPHPALDAIAGRVNPRARCRPVAAGDAALAWEIVIDPDAEPLPDPAELGLARISRGAGFVFERRRNLRD